MFAGYWPKVTSGDEKPFADRLNAIPKIVFSSRWNARPGAIGMTPRSSGQTRRKRVEKLKQRPDGDLGEHFPRAVAHE
jgi:hypothetical protein